MILRQKPPKDFIQVDIKRSIKLQTHGFYPMYMWDGYHYYYPSQELKDFIDRLHTKNGGE
jgi:hypothetical protein